MKCCSDIGYLDADLKHLNQVNPLIVTKSVSMDETGFSGHSFCIGLPAAAKTGLKTL